MTLADRLVELLVDDVENGRRSAEEAYAEVQAIIGAIEAHVRDLEAVAKAAHHAPTCELHTVRIGPDEQPDHPACTCPLGPALEAIR